MKLKIDDYVRYIKRQLSGNLLELEITDADIAEYVQDAVVEISRYYDQPTIITVPFSRCIDLEGFNHSAITNVFRTEGAGGDMSTYNDGSAVDPMYAQQWMIFSNGGVTYNLKNYMMNYIAYNTLEQMRNTYSTDLAFVEDKTSNKLYINAVDIPRQITIEYIPVLTSAEEITSDYWIDILKQLSLAMVKVALGRIRTRFKQTNALYEQDGETMLTEGNEELKTLRENLRVNSSMFMVED